MILLWRLSGTAYLGTLDYGARHYDPRIARWTVPDPMAEKYYGVNAYSYCAGDPVMMVDPDGKDTWEVNGSGKIVKRERDKKTDTFFLVNEEGTLTESISFNYGSIESTVPSAKYEMKLL